MARGCRYPNAAFYAYAYPAPAGFAAGTLSPPEARWENDLGEFILDWDDVRVSPSPREYALEFARSAVRHACAYAAGTPSCRSASTRSRRPSRDDPSVTGVRVTADASDLDGPTPSAARSWGVTLLTAAEPGRRNRRTIDAVVVTVAAATTGSPR